MNEYLFCYVTCKDIEEAKTIGQNLVRERIAACANVLSPMRSIYWWEDQLVEDEEIVLIVKTTQSKFEALNEKIIELHSYDCPCVVALPIEKGNPEYLGWLSKETNSSLPNSN